MSVYVFTGPTLSPAEARVELDAIYLPPVAEGDVYRAAINAPRVIGIIDGSFEHVPSVWHKEILWAMAQGVHVFGAASMGALRAAELAPFGMEGVGEIFRGYRDGVLEDDDEVALMHGPAEIGYAAATVAMVDIRATLAAAEQATVIAPDTHRTLVQLAKRLFYSDRTFLSLLEIAGEQGLPSTQLAALDQWLPRGRVHRKRQDALEMLRLIRQRLTEGMGPKQVEFQFENTTFWEVARRAAGRVLSQQGGQEGMPPAEAILEELRLRGDEYLRCREKAIIRYLAVGRADSAEHMVTDAQALAELDRFSREQNIDDPQQLDSWLQMNLLSRGQLNALLGDQVLLTQARQAAEPLLGKYLLDELRLSGGFAKLAARASDKQRTLRHWGHLQPSCSDLLVTAEYLRRWHFKRLNEPLPNDFKSYATTIGFETDDALVAALAREYCYQMEVCQLANPDAT